MYLIIRRVLLFFSALFVASAACSQSLSIKLKNPVLLDRKNEIVEVSLDNVKSSLGEGNYKVLDSDGNEVISQITYDGKLIFPVTIKPKSSAVYRIVSGMPSAYAPRVFAKIYPSRLDDVAWENDVVAFRAYGPALQKKGERGFGFDIFAKRTDSLFVDELYRLNSAKGPEHKSFHIDHGKGMDAYGVGPTLGAGTPALCKEGRIIYPWAWKTCDILDKGPLRITLRLTYEIKDESFSSPVTETRVVTLDAGSRMNHIKTSFNGVSDGLDVVAGIVLHPENPSGFYSDFKAGYAAFDDLSQKPEDNNGVIRVGILSLQTSKGYVKIFDKYEMPSRPGALGHIIIGKPYKTGSEFDYYMGYGWSKYGFESRESWISFLMDFKTKKANPIKVCL